MPATDRPLSLRERRLRSIARQTERLSVELDEAHELLDASTTELSRRMAEGEIERCRRALEALDEQANRWIIE